MWNTWGNIFYLFVQWLLTIIVARISSPDPDVAFQMAGIFGLSLATTNMFITFAGFGMRNYQVSDLQSEFNTKTYVYSRIITSTVSLIAIIVFVAFQNYTFYTTACILIFMLYKIVEVLFDVFAGSLQKQWRLDIVGQSLIIRAILSIISFTITLIITNDLFSAILAMTIISAISLLFFDFTQVQKYTDYHEQTTIKKIKKLLIICLPLAIYSFLLATMGSLPRISLEKYHGEKLLGIYSNISNPTIIVQALTIQIFTPFISRFSELYNENKIIEFKTLLKKCILFLACFTLVAIIGAYFLGDFALAIIFTKSILPYTYILIPLLIATSLNALSWLLCGLLTVTRDNNALVISNLTGVIVALIASHLLIPKYALMGTVLATIIASLSSIALLSYYLLKKINKGVIQ